MSAPQGKPRGTVRADESVWTLEDGKLLRIVLVKAEDVAHSEKVWESLLEGQFVATAAEFWEMRKKLDLEKFQLEVSRSSLNSSLIPLLLNFEGFNVLNMSFHAFVIQHPGFDFSGAELDKKYDTIPADIVRQCQLAGGNVIGEAESVVKPSNDES